MAYDFCLHCFSSYPRENYTEVLKEIHALDGGPLVLHGNLERTARGVAAKWFHRNRFFDRKNISDRPKISEFCIALKGLRLLEDCGFDCSRIYERIEKSKEREEARV